MVLKRSIMTLYSGTLDIPSHRVRIVLAEKNISVDISYVDINNPPEDLLTLNPYNSLPTLVDRELVLYEAGVITEYLDERFPHPPLLPVYPVARAETRKMMHRIEKDWYSLMHQIESGDDLESARAQLLESLTSLEPVFLDKPYFLSDEFSLLDCALAPLLWRLPKLGVEISDENVGILAYMQRLFKRESFQQSLTDVERQLRAA